MDDKVKFYQKNLLRAASFAFLMVGSSNVFSNPSYNLESCSKVIGGVSKNCYEDDTANGWADTSNGPLDGWASSDIEGWHGAETAAYRFDMSLPAVEDASNYYVRVEQDYLQDGVVGVDEDKDFYVGAGYGATGYTEGERTKHCAMISGGSSLPSLPYQGDECVVAGPTFTGMDDDGDGRVDEEVVNGIDDDGDGLIDEDPEPDCSGSSATQRIQYTAAIHFDSSEAGSSGKKWGFYWRSHLGEDSHNFPGNSVHTRVHSHHEGDSDPVNQCSPDPDLPVPPGPSVYCGGVVATIVGTDHGDNIHATSGDDVISGLGGDDSLHGLGGNDKICGDDGNDHLYGYDGNDVLDGGVGDDYLDGGAGNDQLTGGDGADQMYGQDGEDTLDGGIGDDYLDGGADNDQLSAGAGVDRLYGQGGDDVLDGGDDVDRLYGGGGDDILDGGAGNDYLDGEAGNDQVAGGDGDDRMYGHGGADNLDGGAGTDRCYGGSGTDTATSCENLYEVP